MSSSTATVLDRLALYGGQFPSGEIGPEFPAEDRTDQSLAAVMHTIEEMVLGTALEHDLDPILWGMVNVFHSRLRRVSRDLDDAQAVLKELLAGQDGSEIMTVEIEWAQTKAQEIEAVLDAYHGLREQAAAHYGALTGAAWRPPSGSMVSRARATASVIAAKEFLAARRQKELEGKYPAGPRIGFAGSPRGGDIALVETALDKVRKKYPDMVLVHSGYTKGDDRIAANWAGRHSIPQIIVRMDFDRWGPKRAGFKRNEEMIALGLAGLVLLPGNGVTKNLYQKAAEAGINSYQIKA